MSVSVKLTEIGDSVRQSIRAYEAKNYYHYDGPPMGQRPDDDEVYELATLFIGGKGYWHCGPCDKWHKDDPAEDREMLERLNESEAAVTQ